MAIEVMTKDDLTEAMAPLVGKIASLERTIETLKKEAMPKWLTVKEAAKVLKVSEKTVRRRKDAGEFETKRVGGRIRIRTSSIV